MDCILLAGVASSALSDALQPALAQDAVLCTDGCPALAAAARNLGVERHAVNLASGGA